jgi:putative hemolysin
MINEILVILGLIIFNGLLSMAEISIISSRKSRLENLVKKGSKGAKMALELASRPTRFLSTVQIGITVIGILTGIFSGQGLIDFFANKLELLGLSKDPAELLSVFWVVTIVTFGSLVIGELIPKRLGLNQPEKIASFISPLMKLISQITAPLIWLLSATTDGILRLFGIQGHVEDTQVTEEEVIEIIAQGTSSGTIEELEQDMMERVLLLGDRSVASLMTNRIEIEWLDIHSPDETILETIGKSNHSLFPICDHELDKIIGILSSKKFLLALQSGQKPELQNLLDPVKVIPENMKALAAVEEFKANKTKMAVVVDEFGAVQGLVTQLDLFESIVAEHDMPDEENEISIIQRDENSYLIDALLPFEEFLQYFEIEEVAQEDKTGFHTMGGFILHLTKQIPKTGERFEWKNFQFEVVDMDGNRIDKILMTIHQEELDS